MSVVPSVAPLLISYLFYGKCGKYEKYRWLLRLLPCSLAICFIENVENVKNIGGSLGGSFTYWLSVLGKCGKCKKCWWLSWWLPFSLAICFIENVESMKNVGGSLAGSFAHWFSVL